MKTIKYTVLALFLCGAIGFQLFSPSVFYISGGVEARTDELSDTFWKIDGTTLALQFDGGNGVTLVRKRSKSRGWDTIGNGRYRVRRNTVTFTFDGESANATISGRSRNKMTGRFYFDGKTYVIKATRVD